MQTSSMNTHLSKDLIEKASGAVVDRRSLCIILIIDGMELPFRKDDLPSFVEALDLLGNAGIPVQEEQRILKIFWLMAAAGIFIIFSLWVSQ